MICLIQRRAEPVHCEWGGKGLSVEIVCCNLAASPLRMESSFAACWFLLRLVLRTTAQSGRAGCSRSSRMGTCCTSPTTPPMWPPLLSPSCRRRGRRSCRPTGRRQLAKWRTQGIFQSVSCFLDCLSQEPGTSVNVSLVEGVFFRQRFKKDYFDTLGNCNVRLHVLTPSVLQLVALMDCAQATELG